MENSNLREIAKEFLKANNILLYPHVGIDGDALGSSIAITIALRKLGKKCYILYDEEMPKNLEFMLNSDIPFVTDNMDIISDSELDISCAIDNGAYQRFEHFKDKFNKAKLTVCLDHHSTSEGISQLNYIRPDRSACGEIIFDFLKELNELSEKKVLPDIDIANAIFTAITTDTGNFQFSNTTKEAHLIIASMMDWGFKENPISNEIYENQSISKIKAENLAISRMEILANGKVAVSYISKEELDDLGVKAGETDPIVKTLRSISGVEYAAFLKEKEIGEVRVSYRAKTDGCDISGIAKSHNGGGHKKAAGATLNMPLKDAYEITKKDLIDLANEGRNN